MLAVKTSLLVDIDCVCFRCSLFFFVKRLFVAESLAQWAALMNAVILWLVQAIAAFMITYSKSIYVSSAIKKLGGICPLTRVQCLEEL